VIQEINYLNFLNQASGSGFYTDWPRVLQIFAHHSFLTHIMLQNDLCESQAVKFPLVANIRLAELTTKSFYARGRHLT
jgi:hypothetical protein